MAKRDSKTKRWLAELLEEIEKINLEEEKAPKRVFFNFGMMLSIKFFLERNAKELHFAILNLYNIMICKRALYCFCREYSGCETYYWQKLFCPLCRIGNDLKHVERECDYAQCVKDFLPYLEECYDVMNPEDFTIFSISTIQVIRETDMVSKTN